MLKIIKPEDIQKSDQVVLIPDMEKEEPVGLIEVNDDIHLAFQLNPDMSKKIYDEMFQRAKEESERIAQGILEHARSKKEAIIDQAHAEADSIREQCRQEGYQKGLQDKATQIDVFISDAQQALAELGEEHRQFMALYEKKLEEFSLDIASEVMQKRILEDQLEMAELVKRAISSVRGADWISVELSEKLPRLVSFLQEELNKDQFGHIDILAKDIPIDSCIIQTPDGLINASVSTQVNNLKDYFNQFE